MSEPNERVPLLQVQNLHTQFHSEGQVTKAVNNVSFSLNRGETIGIVGESGSGKSVTALSLMRLIPNPPGRITEGEILFDSKHLGRTDLRLLGKQEMNKIRGNEISMIFQEPMSSLNPVYTCGYQVIENIMRHQQLGKKEATQKALDLFNEVQLPRPAQMLNAYPHEISGGQKQRVMIAMAMSCEPSLLIADEPTTALDVTVQANILELMRRLRDDHGTSIAFISHDLGVIAEIADKVMVMYKGQVVEQGPVFDIFANPQHPYTKGLLACRPRLDPQLKVLPTVADFMEVDAEGQMVEKQGKGKYTSVGQAILFNVVSEEETQQRQEALIKQKPILEVKGLKTHFPIKKGLLGKVHSYVKAVDDVSFVVYPGETLGLVGESGCGKTTLGRTILGLEPSTSGQVVFDGKSMQDMDRKALRALRADMQIIFQDPYSSLNPSITVGEAIMEPMRVHGVGANNKERKDKAIELLETVNLEAGHFNRYPHEFSGGQRQRIGIARCLALNPRFIVCDESVSALDVSVQAQVLNLLNELKERFNFTYIFISHDLSIVKFIADRVMVMKSGKIVEAAYPNDLYLKPQQDYTKKLLNAIPKGDLEDIRKAQLRRKMNK